MTSPHSRNILQEKSVEGVWRHLSARISELGFPGILYGYTNFRSGTSLGDHQDMIILSTMHPDYMKRYIDDGVFKKSCMVEWALSNTGVMSWDLRKQLAASGELSDGALEAIDLNAQYGYTAGFTISFEQPLVRARGAMAICLFDGATQDRADALWAAHGEEIEYLANIAHLKLITLPHANATRPLTRRQRQVLEWVGAGKTVQDVATILGLTAATVEKHLRAARRALDVDTTAQAVLKASCQNQIYVDEAFRAFAQRYW